MKKQSGVKHTDQSSRGVVLAKILALGEREIQEGKVIPAYEAIRRLREKILRPGPDS